VTMKKAKGLNRLLYLFILIWFPVIPVIADGGYFSIESVAVSADQRAIIIRNGKDISMTISTGYTGNGEDFGWIIPFPVPPDIRNVRESGESGVKAFEFLDEISSPQIVSSGGCFPAGMEVLTESGPLAIETLDPGASVTSYNMTSGKWELKKVVKRLSQFYEGDMITINMGSIEIQATGNHPFYVLQGDRLYSRPLPQDIRKEEHIPSETGRWVEARDLIEGDLLKSRINENLVISSVSSRNEKIEVYNLEIEDNHNYTVHQRGILVHNKGGAEDSDTLSASKVTVFGKVSLEHYEVSILGASSASDLISWLRKNDYNVSSSAREVLDSYIDKNWAFVAVKLNPADKRNYKNEFLPPLTINYQYDRMIFPLYISSVSTVGEAAITLYVIDRSTVSSSNFQTNFLKYNRHQLMEENPEKYIKSCIRETTGNRGLATMWSGELSAQEMIRPLMNSSFPENIKIYLTRLEARFEPEAMVDDIVIELDRRPKRFRVHSQGSEVSFRFREFVMIPIEFFLFLTSFLAWIIGILFGLSRIIRMFSDKPIKKGDNNRPVPVTLSLIVMSILLFVSFPMLILFTIPFGFSQELLPVSFIFLFFSAASVVDIIYLRNRKIGAYYFNLVVVGIVILLNTGTTFFVLIPIPQENLFWIILIFFFCMIPVGFLIYLFSSLIKDSEVREYFRDFHSG